MTKSAHELHRVVDSNFESSQGKAHCFTKTLYPKTKLPKKIIHIIFQHGAVEYHKRHNELFDHLRDTIGKSVVISSMDLVGHGLSGGSRAYIEKFDYFVEDFLKFTRLFHHLYSEHEVETHFIGHSLGGMVLIKTLVDKADQIPFKVSSVILTNPCIKPKIDLPPFLSNLSLLFSSKLGKLRLPSLYDGFDLTGDRERAIAFNHDPLNSKFMTMKLGLEILKTSKTITPYSYYLKNPFFFLLSGDDSIVDNEKTKLFISGLDKTKTKVSLYPNSKHDLLNDKDRSQAFKEISHYIKNKTWEKK